MFVIWRLSCCWSWRVPQQKDGSCILVGIVWLRGRQFADDMVGTVLGLKVTEIGFALLCASGPSLRVYLGHLRVLS